LGNLKEVCSGNLQQLKDMAYISCNVLEMLQISRTWADFLRGFKESSVRKHTIYHSAAREM